MMTFIAAAADTAGQLVGPAASTDVFSSDLLNKLGDKYFRRLLIDLVAISLLLWGIYLPNNHKNREFIFTFMMLNVVIFHISYLLNSVEISLGAAFGLFAVFGLLRYRTEDIPMKDMTYLFLSIALGLVVAVSVGDWEPAVICAILLLLTFIMDASFIFKKEISKVVLYEHIAMIKPENHHKLLEDLRARTGLDIHYIRIQGLDYLRDSASIRIYYYQGREGPVQG